jgi:hypothetical protein
MVWPFVNQVISLAEAFETALPVITRVAIEVRRRQ